MSVSRAGDSAAKGDTRWLSGSDLASGADILMHDAQYTAEQYEVKQGWGHSSMEDAIQFAQLNGVKKLLLTHHDPMHTDKQLTEIQNRLKGKMTAGVEFGMAVEGSTIEL